MSRLPSQPNGVLFGVFIALLVGAAVATLSAQAVELMGGREGAGYQLQLPGSGGIPPYRWVIAQGGLPPGLELNRETGLLAGKFIKRGEYSFTVRLTDSRGQNIDEQVTLRVGPPLTNLIPLEVLTTNLPSGVKGKPYSVKIATRGGIAPVSCTLTGTLPQGLNFDAQTCGIDGTPTEAANGPLSILAKDSQEVPAQVSKNLDLAVVGPGVAWWWIVLATVGGIILVVMAWGIYETTHPRCPSCQHEGRSVRLKPRGGDDYYCPVEKTLIEITTHRQYSKKNAAGA